MVQWMNLQWIDRFVNLMQLYIPYGNSGGLHLAEPGLTAGWLAGWLADKIQAKSKNFKTFCRIEYSIFCFVYPRYSIVSAILIHS